MQHATASTTKLRTSAYSRVTVLSHPHLCVTLSGTVHAHGMSRLKNDPGLPELCGLVWKGRAQGRILLAWKAIQERWTSERVLQEAGPDADSDGSGDDEPAGTVGRMWRGDTFVDSWEAVVEVRRS
jgi:hypothetical protein